ncbi:MULTISPECIES: LysR family transcriptional regulator [Acinetobacter]|uniref:LuxR family transcriptional regulator n=2 Tax=Acinetobacter baumannii TaxID=470 RepID=A0AAP1AD36_ACIBA|nr:MULTISPECIES: LysR family transcriptional regulator [Acinetobacter]AIL77805.1 LuxR family transcriptional regulator [Acinetobacter baumannii]AIS06021.1 LuxR family transcriptional regulator [Acinetobacter baumannii]ANA37237.1 LuxR family transcriptional regulator [Acinetobacter baumannii]ANC38441.1 LuxR family transcriptional regulator [Acinetobacter baumannii]APJ20061.1 LuxR family transcriptional regulator [Acinetobacter baumannii]
MFDPRLLRAFVTIFESGSFTAAADKLHLTQSTISQQLARLEESVGHSLIDRTARPLQLTASGEYLIGYAQRILTLQQEAEAVLKDPAGSIPIRIGLPEDMMSTAMAEVFGLFAQEHRTIRLDVTSGLSRNLTERYRNGELDIVIVKESAASADCYASFPEEMAWFESENAITSLSEPICLVTFPQGGLYRDEMFETLERERRRWYIAFTGSSLESVLVSVETGLGISLLPVSTTKGRRVRRYKSLGEASPMVVSIYTWEKAGLISQLVDHMTTVLHDRFQSGS